MSALTSLPENEPSAAASVIFIIGPWAATWFSTAQTEWQEENVRWLVAPEAEDLHKNLSRLRLKTDRVSTFFPFFPDGEESEEQVLAKLTTWRRRFRLEEPLSCSLAIYARLSYEKAAEGAWWSGEVNFSGRETTVEQALEELIAAFAPRCRPVIYRHAMTEALRLWLAESGIAKALHSLFTTSPLRLSDVLLADSNEGFTRHGAWSCWLHRKFRLYPGLSSAVVLPGLPAVSERRAPLFVSPDSGRGFALPWLPVLVALLLAFCLVASAWLTGSRINAASHALAEFQQTDEMQLQKKRAAYQRITLLNQQLLRCRDAWYSRIWGSSPCGKMAERARLALQNYDPAPVFMPSGSVALFDRGSATLRPESSQSLASLLPLIRDNAQTLFMIVGHADNTGSAQNNLQLSTRRARAVRDWLVSHAQVSPDRFTLGGMGDSSPVASNQTEKGRKQNRRVEIIPLPNSAHVQTGKNHE
ncbi:OmpA family protein [Kalamiella sp. sgz302252]|uniref:OmpA family protein n=1 Tax=Pantoea sp. sgz302252 TaxID=3341827 RepID=UPI0036D39F09